MPKAVVNVTLKDFGKVKELFESASDVLPDINDRRKRNRLARALKAFSEES